MAKNVLLSSTLQHYVVPSVLIVLSVGVVFYLAIIGQGEEFSLKSALEYSLGDTTSWKFILIFWMWAIIWLRVPSKIAYGTETKFGTRPCIKDNGMLYYSVTLVAFFLLQAFYPNTSTHIYTNFPKIVGVLNILGLGLSLCFLLKGKYKPEHPEFADNSKSLIYHFFKGIEVQPKLFGCDVKQLLNDRIPWLTTQLLLCAFYIVGLEKHGFNTASLVHLLLHSVYIAKFYWKEVAFFFAGDMAERDGFYLIYGMTAAMPVLFTFAGAHSIVVPPTISPITSILIGIFGLTCIFLTYKVDCEKLLLRQSANYECLIWGKPAKYILAEFKDMTGKIKKSALLTSGFWGLARHMNYTFEIGAIFAICACLGFDRGVWNFVQFSYVPFKMFYRLTEGEEEIKNKYGKYWEKYCNQVPYKMIPGIW